MKSVVAVYTVYSAVFSVAYVLCGTAWTMTRRDDHCVLSTTEELQDLLDL